MVRSWTFTRQVAAGFAVCLLFLALVGAVSYRCIVSLIGNAERVTHTYAVMQALDDLRLLARDAETGERGYIITGDDAFLQPYREAMTRHGQVQRTLRDLVSDNPRQQQRVDQATQVLEQRLTELQRIAGVRRDQGLEAAAQAVRLGHGKQLTDELRALLSQIAEEEQQLLQERTRRTEAAARLTTGVILGGTTAAFAAAALIAALIIRLLRRRLGSAVQHLQTSTSQLQTTASQQATGAKEQATAMTEITTTIKELLATSQQIAESAQRVVQIAERTRTTARAGTDTVQRAQEAVSAIQRQVDLIVGSMLDLGRKSQQIGGILEIINELAEQTNILSINATIEAAGAGEAGRRFAVVADEIRKLADRVGGSTKEIRGLIDEIRAAVNSTVMTTESGKKSVDAGTQRFGEVTESLSQIVTVVETTAEAAREIELSTKQQATAVSQVNIGVADVAQAAREMEGGAGQTLQTATQLSSLAKDLLRLVDASP